MRHIEPYNEPAEREVSWFKLPSLICAQQLEARAFYSAPFYSIIWNKNLIHSHFDKKCINFLFPERTDNKEFLYAGIGTSVFIGLSCYMVLSHDLASSFINYRKFIVL